VGVTSPGRIKLRVYLQNHFCGCGDPRGALTSLKSFLESCARDRPDGVYAGGWVDARISDDGLRWLFLYMMDQHSGLIEHGSAASSAWLTPLGVEMLALMRAEPDLDAVLGEHCACGHDYDDEEHRCLP
jgi:hypothetical protein